MPPKKIKFTGEGLIWVEMPLPSRFIWENAFPDPTVKDLADRYEHIMAALAKKRARGEAVPAEWLRELGLCNIL